MFLLVSIETSGRSPSRRAAHGHLSPWRDTRRAGDDELMNLPRRLTAAVLGCAVLVVPAACSGGDDFCDVVTDARTMMDETGDHSIDEAAISWTETGEEMEETDAPEEIADEWARMTSTVVQVGEYFTSGTPEQKAEDTARALMEEDYRAARTAVYDYADASCEA